MAANRTTKLAMATDTFCGGACCNDLAGRRQGVSSQWFIMRLISDDHHNEHNMAPVYSLYRTKPQISDKQANKQIRPTVEQMIKQVNNQTNSAMAPRQCKSHSVISFPNPNLNSSNYFLLLIQIHFFGIFRHTLSSCKEPPMLCRRWPQMSNRS